MRIGKVVGKLSLQRAHPALTGKRWVLAQMYDLDSLAAGGEPKHRDELIVLDELGAMPGDLVGITEGMEAAFPFHPDLVPIDAYVACLIDDLDLDEQALAELRAKR